MNVNDLVQFGLKGNSAASDVNFIKSQPAIASALCQFFNLNVEDGAPTIQAAQYAVNESYRNNGDDAVTVETIAAAVNTKMEAYRNKLRKFAEVKETATAATPVAEVVETVAVEVQESTEAPAVEASETVAEETNATEVVVLTEVPTTETVVKRGRGRPRKVVDPNAPVVVKTVKNPGAGKGRPKLAAGLSQYDRVVTWVNSSKFVGIVDNDRNAAAIACSLETAIPVGSVLVYFSKGIKAKAFS